MSSERYEVGRVLGRGGMAEVFEAVARGHHGFERRVAIKRLSPDASGDATLARMFLDEARIASRLHHAGIVSVIDYGEAEGAPFQVLELVEGRDAGFLVRAARARVETVPVAVALHVVKEVAYALAHAHEAKDDRGEPLGIVHRDVKPSNILVSWAGDVKLGDFGIALARERCAQTTGLVAKGTPGYMSPEQLIGGVVDATTDTFALGCTLHGLLVGESPLTQEAARGALLRGEELPLSPELPDDVAPIVRRAVKRRPDERYATARELAEDLGRALAKRLTTDPKTTLLRWLGRFERPERTGAAPTTEILSAAEGGEHRFTRTVTKAAPGAARSTTDGAGSRRVFVVALTATLVLAAVGGLGVVLGRGSRGEAVAKADADVVAMAMADAMAMAEADAQAAADADAAAAADAEADAEAAAEADAASTARRPAGPSGSDAPWNPVPNGCLCVPTTPPTSSLCHPRRASRPLCECTEDSFGFTKMCWRPFVATAPIGASWRSLCPETQRELPSATREGAACTAFPMVTRTSADGGSETATQDARDGTVNRCRRCGPDGLLAWPRTPGAPCSGVRPSNGELARGVIDCATELGHFRR